MKLKYILALFCGYIFSFLNRGARIPTVEIHVALFPSIRGTRKQPSYEQHGKTFNCVAL